MTRLGITKNAALTLLNALRAEGAVLRVGSRYYPADAVTPPDAQPAAVLAFPPGKRPCRPQGHAPAWAFPRRRPPRCCVEWRRRAASSSPASATPSPPIPPTDPPHKRHTCKQQKTRKLRYFRVFLHLNYEPRKSIYIPPAPC